MDDKTQKTLYEAGWQFPEMVWDGLSDYQKSFALLEFTGLRTFTYYQSRLRSLGFVQMSRVLDAGCGMGQWSIALSALNEQVYGVDINEDRLEVARALAVSHNRPNCEFRNYPLESLPFATETFDGIFCYGVFMFTDMPCVLAEFFRLLKPGGRVYLNANTTGWYAHMIIDRGFRQRKLRNVSAAWNMILRTLLGKTSQIVVRRKWLQTEIARAGLRLIQIGVEGEICVDEALPKPEPAYRQYYYGMPSILEVLAQKT